MGLNLSAVLNNPNYRDLVETHRGGKLVLVAGVSSEVGLPSQIRLAEEMLHQRRTQLLDGYEDGVSDYIRKGDANKALQTLREGLGNDAFVEAMRDQLNDRAIHRVTQGIPAIH